MEIPGYEIHRLIGQGGMATAYLAEQKSLGRDVVLKILDSSVNEAPDTVERFINEGRIIASLNHPHIITIYDIGMSADKVYISMEFVEGGDLKQRMSKKVFAPVEAVDVLEKLPPDSPPRTKMASSTVMSSQAIFCSGKMVRRC